MKCEYFGDNVILIFYAKKKKKKDNMLFLNVFWFFIERLPQLPHADRKWWAFNQP